MVYYICTHLRITYMHVHTGPKGSKNIYFAVPEKRWRLADEL